jgi:hypothetical protein
MLYRVAIHALAPAADAHCLAPHRDGAVSLQHRGSPHLSDAHR